MDEDHPTHMSLNRRQIKWLKDATPFKCVRYSAPRPFICIELAKKFKELPLEEEFEWLYQAER